ncbi:MAG: signal peptidase I, partial [Dehalococcoidia bacterium]
RPAQQPVAVVVCAAGAIGAALLVAFIRRRYYRVEVAGRSMHPALQPGDYLIVRRGPPEAGVAAFGRIAALRDTEGRLLLKRVVGLPGEALRVGTVVQVNGRALVEPYAHGASPQAQFRGLNRLGDGEYFLLGDRRDASTDSRNFGPVHRDRLDGVAIARYWPPARIGRLARPRRELAGVAPGDGGAADGIVGAGRALRASAGRSAPAGSDADARPRDRGSDASERGRRSGEP